MQYTRVGQAAADDAVRRSSDDVETDEKDVFSRGWKFSISLNAGTALAILFINVAVTIWASTKENFRKEQNTTNYYGEGDDSIRTIYKGQCETVKKLNTAIHLIINIFSSVLLAASNYCMQCLSAPTRHDIQKAHSQGWWLDIGVPSVHNLRRIPSARSSLWWILMISSLPLHLLLVTSVAAACVSS